MPAVDLAAIRERRDDRRARQEVAARLGMIVDSDVERDVDALLARVESLEADLRRERARYDACAMALGDCGNKRMVAERAAKDWRDIAEARDARLKAAALCACSERPAEPAAPLSPPEPRSTLWREHEALPGAIAARLSDRRTPNGPPHARNKPESTDWRTAVPISPRQVSYTTVVVDCDHCEARLYDPESEADDHYDMTSARDQARRQGWVISDDEKQAICPSDDADHHAAIDRL